MCYSAQASFIAAGYLLLAGLWNVKKNKIRSAQVFAAMPLIFAAQQLIEGVIWLHITHNFSFIDIYAPYLYLFCAFFIWPIFIPVSILLLEENQNRKNYIKMCVFLGIFVSINLYAYVIAGGAYAELLSCHIYYDLQIPYLTRIFLTILYLCATVIPFLISTIKQMPLFGLLLLASYIFSFHYYYMHILSTWCFFAALLSGCVCIIITQLNKPKTAQF